MATAFLWTFAQVQEHTDDLEVAFSNLRILSRSQAIQNLVSSKTLNVIVNKPKVHCIVGSFEKRFSSIKLNRSGLAPVFNK